MLIGPLLGVACILGRRRAGAAVQNSTIYCGTNIETPDAITAGLGIARAQTKNVPRPPLPKITGYIYSSREHQRLCLFDHSWTLFEIRPT